MTMKRETREYAGYWIRRFLSEYLASIRNLSGNTLMAYRDAIRLLLGYVEGKTHKSPDEMLVTDLTADHVRGLLNHIETERGCSVTTRNLRLAAFYALAKYVAVNCPEYVEWCRSIRAIPVKRTATALITYLEKDEMDALLALPDQTTKQGWRDYVLLLFLYNTGARAEEAATLKIMNLSLPPGKGLSVVTIIGKGRKTRCCPLWDETKKALQAIIMGRKDDENVFLNRLNQPMTRFGVYEMVTRYAKRLKATMPSIRSKRVSPHTIRHTTATHLLQAGVDINTIRAWLGHVSVNTTNVYAEVNMEMKAKALQACETSRTSKRKHWRDDKKLMDFLAAL